jgi:ParB-like chromosome segregation protein Spo0J
VFDAELQPISRIEWLPAEVLSPNHYNPNYVLGPELRLLERSLLRCGWVQPVLISPANVIIDGFHRWRLSMESAALKERYETMVPCARLDVGPDEAMVITVRMNRAKGTHGAVPMSNLVRRLLDEYLWDPQQIAVEIGATIAEVELLAQEDVFKARNIPAWSYSSAWEPYESTAEPR